MCRVRDTTGRLVYAYDTPPPGTNRAGSTIRGGRVQGRSPSVSTPEQELEWLEHSTTLTDSTILPTHVDGNFPMADFARQGGFVKEEEPPNKFGVNNQGNEEQVGVEAPSSSKSTILEYFFGNMDGKGDHTSNRGNTNGESSVGMNTFEFPIRNPRSTITHQMKNIPHSALPNFHGMASEDPDTFLFEFDVLCRSYDYVTN